LLHLESILFHFFTFMLQLEASNWRLEDALNLFFSGGNVEDAAQSHPLMSEEETTDQVMHQMNLHDHGSPLPASRPFDPSLHPGAFGGFSPLDSFFPASGADRDLGPGMDPELQRILALSAATSRQEQIQEEFIRSTAPHGQRPNDLGQDVGIGPIDDDEDDLEFQRCLALSAGTDIEELQRQEYASSATTHLPTAVRPPAPPRPPSPRPPAASAVGDDEEAAFIEAAIMASLEQAQPAASDEDDPLLAQALKASLEADTDPAAAAAAAAAAATAGPLFPHLRAQQEAEARAATRQRNEGAGFAPGDFDPALFGGGAAGLPDGFFFDEGDDAPLPLQQRQPSERTLENRRLRQDQDMAYEESLAADRAKEESRLEALRREKCVSLRAARMRACARCVCSCEVAGRRWVG
jgi:hypothetical protein